MAQEEIAPQIDPATEACVMAFIDLIHERKLAGKPVLAATHKTIARWLSERTGLRIIPRHVQVLTQVMEQANLITIGGGGIGLPNTYASREDAMGPNNFGIKWTLYSWYGSIHPGMLCRPTTSSPN